MVVDQSQIMRNSDRFSGFSGEFLQKKLEKTFIIMGYDYYSEASKRDYKKMGKGTRRGCKCKIKKSRIRSKIRRKKGERE